MAQPANGNVHTALLDFAAREEVDILILGSLGRCLQPTTNALLHQTADSRWCAITWQENVWAGDV